MLCGCSPGCRPDRRGRRVRSFVAIGLPDDLRDALVRLQAGIPAGRITPEENLHLTLAFLGEVDRTRLQELHDQLDMFRAVAPPLIVRGLGTFGGRRPGVLYADIVPDEGLLALRNAVRRAARIAGIALPHERFHPHITLARFNAALAEGEIARIERFLTLSGGVTLPEVWPEHFALFASELRPDGARHEMLADYPFPAASA